MTNELFEKLATEQSNPCVTVSLKTHRTFPDCEKDEIRLKNLFKEAGERLTDEFGKREVNGIFAKMDEIMETYDFRHSLDSLHIFLSNSTKEVVRSPWPVDQNKVHISDGFAVKPLIIMNERVTDYMILLLSKSGSRLYLANNDKINSEIENDVFPSTDNPFDLTSKVAQSDSGKMDSMLLEYFNRIDKAVVKVHRENGLKVLVVATEENYKKLKKVADVPSVYIGYSAVNYNDDSVHTISKSAWEVIQANQKSERTKAIEEMQLAVSQGKVLTDLREIYQAAKEGRGELLIVHNNYLQPVKMNGDNTIELIDDETAQGAIDDINSVIAKEVVSKNGRVIFTNQDEIKSLGKIVLKTRF
ncbi:MAG: hypothetical protein WCY16_03645 [Weeksellaceae bacterium]